MTAGLMQSGHGASLRPQHLGQCPDLSVGKLGAVEVFSGQHRQIAVSFRAPVRDRHLHQQISRHFRFHGYILNLRVAHPGG